MDGWLTDPARLASALEELNGNFKKAQAVREQQAVELATLRSDVREVTAAVHRIEEFGLRAAIAIVTVVVGWMLSVIR